jgi:uncharacterized protein YcnI
MMSTNMLCLPRASRLAAAAVLGAGLVLLAAAAADAHVRVIPESTAAGDFTKLTFRVPNESETASTTKLSIQLPTSSPLAFVSAQPVPGWSIEVRTEKLATPVTMEGTTITEAPAQVTWTASKGRGVAPGQFQEFALSGGPLPDASQHLAFPATQTYSDGTVVRWNQPQPAGADEPEYPVPAFDITAPDNEVALTDQATGAQTSPGSATPAATDTLARGLGIGGLVVGFLGLGAGAAASRNRPRTS